jgi:hypothetical protein
MTTRNESITPELKLRKQIRVWIILMMAAIIISGITAFPVETELAWILRYRNILPGFVANWLNSVYQGISETNSKYPFLAYGYDWLAFAHIVIAISFIGPLRDPVKNIWIIEWSMICCFAVIPLAFIAGPIRHIPFFHQLVDCSFGIIGLIPLVIVRKKIKKLEGLKSFLS